MIDTYKWNAVTIFVFTCGIFFLQVPRKQFRKQIPTSIQCFMLTLLDDPTIYRHKTCDVMKRNRFVFQRSFKWQTFSIELVYPKPPQEIYSKIFIEIQTFGYGGWKTFGEFVSFYRRDTIHDILSPYSSLKREFARSF